MQCGRVGAELQFFQFCSVEFADAGFHVIQTRYQANPESGSPAVRSRQC